VVSLIIEDGLDDMRGRHSIRRRWGRYEGYVEFLKKLNITYTIFKMDNNTTCKKGVSV
jgi:hypothetical protein